MKGLLLVLIFAAAKENGVLADDTMNRNIVKPFLDQIDEIQRRVNGIIELNNVIQKDLPTILNKKVSTALENHPVVRQAQNYLNSSREGKYLSTVCETLFNSKYNSLKTEIYQKLFQKIVRYYDEITYVLTTRFQEELIEFKRRVNELYKSPDDADVLRAKMNKAFEVISDIEIAQHEIIVKTLNYFKKEDSAQLIYDHLFVPFTECLQNTYVNKH